MRSAWISHAAGAAALVTLAASGAQAAEPVTYSCVSGRTIIATYGDESARLAFDGHTFELHQARSASGARYATEQGLQPDHGLQWWIKGDDATLNEMIMDHAAPLPRTIDTCHVTPAKP
jgi:membrane-bound inhibitor of C-type lysozyme